MLVYFNKKKKKRVGWKEKKRKFLSDRIATRWQFVILNEIMIEDHLLTKDVFSGPEKTDQNIPKFTNNGSPSGKLYI